LPSHHLKYKLNTEPFFYLEIEGLWTKDELDLLRDEMLELQDSGQLLPDFADITHAGNKVGEGGFVHELFENPNDSKMHTVGFKLWNALVNNIQPRLGCWFFNKDDYKLSTLLNYYDHGDHYGAHVDEGHATGISWFWKGPKKFTGGELVFTDYNITVPMKENYSVIFPACIKHEVLPLHIEDVEYRNKGYGRFALTQFAI